MIRHIHATAFFPTSGATLSGDFQPQSGITAVVGENGAGKTFLTIEATRWLLFGKAALRGAAMDYKNAQVQGTFTIRGSDYEISRGKVEELRLGGFVIAKGAEKVTEKVTDLLGYGLDVFDLCNAATQGNVQALGDMRPAQRKALIDSVLKLTEAENAEKECREEAKGYKREAETLAKMLRAPGDKPTGNHLPSAQVRDDLTALRALRDRAAALNNQLTMIMPPTKPDGVAFTEDDIADLRSEVDNWREDARHRRNLQVSADAYDLTIEQIEAAQARLDEADRRAARGAPPTLTAEEIEQGYAEIAAAEAYTASEEVTCPKCDHTFRPTGAAPPTPRWSRNTLAAEDRAFRLWHGHDPKAPLPEGAVMDQRAIDLAKASWSSRVELTQLAPLGPDRTGELEDMLASQRQVEAYTMDLLRYERAREANQIIRDQIDALGNIPEQAELDALSDALRDAEVYEAALRTWEREDAEYRNAQAKIIEANHLAAEYKAGAEDITKARATVKALIAPKISRIATGLIRDMSMNKLRDLIVDDEMEITVGGQRIETLSGAGKTVANLALRVAMGQALVGHVFPVFLADEIDGDLSVSRRAATLQALVSLKKHLSQIILVTHRGADIADHVYEVTG